MRKFVSFGPAFVVLLAALAVLSITPAALQRLNFAQLSAKVSLAENRLEESAEFLERLNRATRDVAASVLPGVVHIRVEASPPRFQGNEDEDQPRRWPAPRASAAGWFYNDAGFVVTNAHVVADARAIRVEMYDGRVREAEVVGVDDKTDIAVIRVNSVPGVLPLRRATGDAVFVGDRVFAFGSPFGIKFSMSQGIVSGLGRTEAATLVGMTGGYTNFIQTDAAMNPGNSGGPLVDSRGRVVGMSTAIANNTEFSFNDRSPQGQSAGIGFAIPIETIESVVSQLIESSVVLRGYLGITMDEYSPDRGRAIGVSYDGPGAIVTQVRQGHPAAKAGLEPGDVIVQVLGQPCTRPDVLRSLVSIRKPGTRVPLTIWREGELQELDVSVGAAYFAPNNEGLQDLIYVDGSESMSIGDIRKRIDGPTNGPRVD